MQLHKQKPVANDRVHVKFLRNTGNCNQVIVDMADVISPDSNSEKNAVKRPASDIFFFEWSLIVLFFLHFRCR